MLRSGMLLGALAPRRWWLCWPTLATRGHRRVRHWRGLAPHGAVDPGGRSPVTTSSTTTLSHRHASGRATRSPSLKRWGALRSPPTATRHARQHWPSHRPFSHPCADRPYPVSLETPGRARHGSRPEARHGFHMRNPRLILGGRNPSPRVNSSRTTPRRRRLRCHRRSSCSVDADQSTRCPNQPHRPPPGQRLHVGPGPRVRVRQGHDRPAGRQRGVEPPVPRGVRARRSTPHPSASPWAAVLAAGGGALVSHESGALVHGTRRLPLEPADAHGPARCAPPAARRDRPPDRRRRGAPSHDGRRVARRHRGALGRRPRLAPVARPARRRGRRPGPGRGRRPGRRSPRCSATSLDRASRACRPSPRCSTTVAARACRLHRPSSVRCSRPSRPPGFPRRCGRCRCPADDRRGLVDAAYVDARIIVETDGRTLPHAPAGHAA